MPLGPYKDFTACLIAQRNKGHSSESAHKICGALEQKVGSQEQRSASNDSMSFPPQQKQEQKPKEESAQGLNLSVQEAEDVVSALVNAKEAVGSQAPELTQQLDKALMIFNEKAEVSE